MHYIDNPSTKEDYINNILFQAAEVKAYIEAKMFDLARIKTECLVNDLRAYEKFSSLQITK